MGVAYEIRYHPKVVHDDIPAMSGEWRARVKASIEQKLAVEPELFGIPLRRSLKGHRKLRVGDYRVVFRIEGKTVYVIAILHRSVVYQMIPRRTM